jgi:hypothetical protein
MVKCDQCESLTINGVYTHELGCPNRGKTYDPEREQWIRYLNCRICGYPVEEGTACGCQNQ